ncbi:cupin domain-containing protein [Psychrobacillus sp. L4]|uniref:cupin domain-containing protein n=1 Tax=Psychrobacillus sp. L4 TaxID=3236892 RepID=UPI0036F20AF9
MKISKQNADHYIWGDHCDGWHLVKNKELSVIHERMPVYTTEVLHYHSQTSKFFFVLSGIAIIEIDGELNTLNSYDGIEVPPLTQHQTRNESNQDVEFLVISQPNSRGDRVNK